MNSASTTTISKNNQSKNSKLTSAQIRKQFIDFFKEKHNHQEVESSPVVPHDDPTLLFANAGMNQFKDVFLGTGKREYNRAVDTQKCIRAGGKHNDLEDVGKDTYHHTFFEMLGNWSFGDYFKEEAIKWAWELLTEVWGLEKDRLHATVFGGDKEDGTPADEEAAQLWRQVTDINPENIHYGSKEDNFWEMGESGPCGPCSEIHIDRTPDKSGAKLVNADHQDVIEIWNLVFIQFNRDKTGKLFELPAQHVDTGMGFERICAVLQGKNSNYDTDVFTTLFAAIEKVTGAREYDKNKNEPVDIAYRVIADHIRCLTFALTDGAVPSNEGRGYVLRRILRRAVRHGRQTLGMQEPFLYKLVDAVVEQMSSAFPELKKNPRQVAEIIKEEEHSFNNTLDRGIELFEQAAKRVETNKDGSAGVPPAIQSDSQLRREAGGTPALPVISGKDAFTLYDTYGFPVDLTQVMAQERGMSVDMEGFHKQMEKARQLSRQGSKDSADAKDSLTDCVQKNDLPQTEFIGYENLELENYKTAVHLFKLENEKYVKADSARKDEHVALAIDKTPFYAQMGGQVGDSGKIIIGGRAGLDLPDSAGQIEIYDCQQVGEVIFHLGKINQDLVCSAYPTKMEISLYVDCERRTAIAANHTSTHILNRALRKFVNEEADQRGSLVDEHKLRFDFSNNGAVSKEQLEQVEAEVTQDIEKDLPINCAVADQQKARNINGLRAVFGEKYPPKVRVVSIGAKVEDLLTEPDNEKWANLSIEFCGGTHLAHTGIAQSFVITHEEGVAKGIRRITALTGDLAKDAKAQSAKLVNQLNELTNSKHEDAQKFSKKITDLTNEIGEVQIPATVSQKLRAGIKNLQNQLKKLQKQEAAKEADIAIDAARQLADNVSGKVIVENIEGLDGKGIRKAMDIVKAKHPESAILLASAANDKVALIAEVPNELIEKGLKAGDWIKQAAEQVGGGGGGRPSSAQAGGKVPEKIEEALQAAKEFAKQYK